MPLDAFTTETRRLIDQVESDLHKIARMSMCRDDALHIKQRMSRPIGILGSKNHIPSDRDARRKAYAMNGVHGEEDPC